MVGQMLLSDSSTVVKLCLFVFFSSYLKPTLEDYQDQVSVLSGARGRRGRGDQVATVKRGGGVCRQLLRCLGCDRLAGRKRLPSRDEYEMVEDYKLNYSPALTEQSTF